MCTVCEINTNSYSKLLPQESLYLSKCKYTNPKEQIIDALIFGSNIPCVQSKLLEYDGTLTLDKAINIARTQEAASNQGYQMHSNYNSQCPEVGFTYKTAFNVGKPNLR